MVHYRFHLTGVPPDQAIKLIGCDPNQSVAEIKKSVQREYQLNPILAIQFIYKGKTIPDNIIVMANQAGGYALFSSFFHLNVKMQRLV
ncbi:MAG: hypothetical protein RBG13Loki_2124 [Promethearchaeota archaeon CR_4]|nr:MAG: hypothetical protein RBG13Loki_2124 [Candidatus Lokiarchaeota archaeon CR_4]